MNSPPPKVILAKVSSPPSSYWIVGAGTRSRGTSDGRPHVPHPEHRRALLHRGSEAPRAIDGSSPSGALAVPRPPRAASASPPGPRGGSAGGQRRAPLVVGRLQGPRPARSAAPASVVGPSGQARARPAARRRRERDCPFSSASAGASRPSGLLDQGLDQVAIPRGDRRKNVVAGAALDQQAEARPGALACRPSDDLAVVQVSRAVHVGARVEEHAQSPARPPPAAKWRGARGRRGRGRWGRRRARAAGAPPRDVAPPRAARSRPRSGSAGEAGIRRAGRAASRRPRQRTHEELREVRRAPAVDFGLQRAPAREAVLAGDRELRVGQLAPRDSGARSSAQAILRELLQVLEGRAFGELGDMDTFLPYAPGVRCCRAGSQGR